MGSWVVVGSSLGSWSDVVSVTCGVHVVAHCTKSTLLAMRLSEAVVVDKYMAAGHGVRTRAHSVWEGTRGV